MGVSDAIVELGVCVKNDLVESGVDERDAVKHSDVLLEREAGAETDAPQDALKGVSDELLVGETVAGKDGELASLLEAADVVGDSVDIVCDAHEDPENDAVATTDTLSFRLLSVALPVAVRLPVRVEVEVDVSVVLPDAVRVPAAVGVAVLLSQPEGELVAVAVADAVREAGPKERR